MRPSTTIPGLGLALLLASACAPDGAPPTDGRPNVIVLVADDLAPGVLGFDGNEHIRTPQLDRLAAGGLVFDRAYVPLPQCGPSRAAMLTGRYPHRLGVLTNDGARIPPRTPTLANRFRAAGYRCGFVGKWGLGSEDTPQAGFQDYWRSLARTDTYQDPTLWVDGKRVRREGWMSDVLVSLALEFVEQAPAEPFLLWVSLKTPHGPLMSPPDESLAYESAALPLPRSLTDDLGDKPSFQRTGRAQRAFATLGIEGVQAERAVLQAMVGALDRSIGDLVAGLERAGVAERTLLVFLSDNGWLMGEHRMVGKGASLYEELVRTPMFLHWPGRVPAGARSAELVSTLDLFPTLVSLLDDGPGTNPAATSGTHGTGATAAIAAIDGVDLWPLIDGMPGPLRDALFLAYWKKKPDDEPVPLLGVVTRESKYTRYLDSGEEELYDLAADPAELSNLAGSEQHREELEHLRRLVDYHAKTIERPFW